jgi:microcystin-dependent protein
MTLSVKHSFVSPKAEGTDSTLVGPIEWNHEHNLTVDQDGVVLGRPAGAGAGSVIDIQIAALMSMLFPPGFILPWPAAVAPDWWALMQGQSVLRTDPIYAPLFGVIGTTFGSVDSTHFNLPDGRGVVMGGVDAGRGLYPELNALGVRIGARLMQLGVYGNVSASSGNFNIGGTTGNDDSATTVQGPSGNPVDVAAHTHRHSWGQTLNVGVSGGISNDGANRTDQFQMAQPTLAINWIIKL